LQRHSSHTHGDNNPLVATFGCDLCEGIFVLEMSLSKHKSDVHNITDNRTFQCLICPDGNFKIRGIHWHVKVRHEKDANETHMFYALIPDNIQEYGNNQEQRNISRNDLIKAETSEDESGSERSALQIVKELNDSVDEEYLQKSKVQKSDKHRKWIKYF
jgi:hypothetical protein